MGDIKEISIHDIKHINIGHAQNEEHATAALLFFAIKRRFAGLT